MLFQRELGVGMIKRNNTHQQQLSLFFLKKIISISISRCVAICANQRIFVNGANNIAQVVDECY
jgi:hypothetical protein